MEEATKEKVKEGEDDAPIAATPTIKTSGNLKTLKSAEPIENIAVLSKESSESAEVAQNQKVTSAEKLETVYDTMPPLSDKKRSKSAVCSVNVGDVKSNNVSKEHVNDEAPVPLRQLPKQEVEKRRIGSATSSFISEKINRNQSDIFSLKDETTIASSIFSINGSPSRKVYRKVQKSSNSNVFPFGQVAEPPSEQATPRDKMRDKDSYHDVKRPSSSLRNPLTGTGLNSNDEYKRKGKKRIDGNPLLGLGYTPEATPSTHRIPPGGYSHKLW